MQQTFPKLETLTNVAILFTAVFCIVTWTRAFLATPAAPSDGSAYYSPGEGIPPIDGVNFSNGATNLVLIVSSTCRFCTESMPFYRRVVESRNSSGARVQLVVLGQESRASLLEYLASHAFVADVVISVGGNSGLKVNRTPAILQTDGSGRILRTWNGRLSTSAEEAVLRAAASDSGPRALPVLE